MITLAAFAIIACAVPGKVELAPGDPPCALVTPHDFTEEQCEDRLKVFLQSFGKEFGDGTIFTLKCEQT